MKMGFDQSSLVSRESSRMQVEGDQTQQTKFGRRGPPHPSPLPEEREHISTAREKSLNRGRVVRSQTVHPLLGERAGVRGTATSERQELPSGLVTHHASRITHHIPPSSFVIRHSSFRHRGFTLIEIMIAIGIFSMVLAAIYSTWTAILRSSQVGRQAAASMQRARITIRILEDSLSSAQMFLGNRRSNYYAFEAENGDEPRLSFVARLSKSFPRGGKFGDLDVRRLTYTVEAGPDNSRQLVLRQYPILMGDEAFDERDRPLVLAKNVKNFEFQFWDSRLNDWTDEWKPVNQLPRLIMVTISLLDNPTSTSARETVTRIVNIPSLPVQPGWQPSVLPGAGPQTPPPPPAQGGQLNNQGLPKP